MSIFTSPVNAQKGKSSGEKLQGVDRCPHCGVVHPNLYRAWSDTWFQDGEKKWASYRCNSCDSVVTGLFELRSRKLEAVSIWPELRAAHHDIPEPARTYLQQAYETLHAPDAAAVMAGSAVDAMLKMLGYGDTSSIYERIDKALADGHVTKGMAAWGKSVCLGASRPHRAAAQGPHISPDEAKLSVDFADALGSFLFVLTARVERGAKAAGTAGRR